MNAELRGLAARPTGVAATAPQPAHPGPWRRGRSRAVARPCGPACRAWRGPPAGPYWPLGPRGPYPSLRATAAAVSL